MGSHQRIRVGLIGSGFMGRTHADAFRRAAPLYPHLPVHPALHTLADVTADVADGAARQLGFASSMGDWPALVAHPEIDLVDITTSNMTWRLRPSLPVNMSIARNR